MMTRADDAQRFDGIDDVQIVLELGDDVFLVVELGEQPLLLVVEHRLVERDLLFGSRSTGC